MNTAAEVEKFCFRLIEHNEASKSADLVYNHICAIQTFQTALLGSS